ncbi:MAG TPA: glucan biosynthesis protein [Arenibaculum sp.]|nr:glucan biosynthesis protein [Arenibaculum sp.]
MSDLLSRRRILRAAAALPFLPPLMRGALAAAPGQSRGLPLGPAEAFSFETVIETARSLAARPYQPPEIRHERVLDSIDYDAHQSIRFREDMAIWGEGWGEGGGPYPVQLFHPGRYFKQPVQLFLVEDDVAREVHYLHDAFDFQDPEVEARLPGDLGWAGMRFMNPPGEEGDWLVFLGASYFRSAGELNQYGQSARGLAVNTGMSYPEEFPSFSRFWLAPAPDDPTAVVIHALLEGPSVAGAYRIRARKPGPVVMDVESRLFARDAIERLGVAPLTSMFWFGESNRHQATDWRPEVHDTDGLALWTGTGERIWRPLANPPGVTVTSYQDTDPRGFGLMQRDRNFDHYQDDGVFYDRRPSVWVEPKGNWGAGSVHLVEIPTDDEIFDNIVAFWVPAEPVTPGSAWSFDYRLHWAKDHPEPAADLARTVATRIGRGGIPGQPRPPGQLKFAVDFAGGPLEALGKDQEKQVEVMVETSRGTLRNVYPLQVVGTSLWRAFFDLAAEGEAPVDLRLYLSKDGRPLTETWLHHHVPFEF